MRHASVAASDPQAIQATIARALAAAGIGTIPGPVRGVAATVGRALAGSGLPARPAASGADDSVIEGSARVVGRAEPRVHPASPAAERSDAPGGRFLAGSFTNGAGTRVYRLYVPAERDGFPEAMPLVVMLHGCTQSPEDFATGTRMNALADRHGFLVLYPGQATHANGSNCWNWFRAEDQLRDRGEPSLIAGITRETIATHRVDPTRIFVAGLSAGAAMAVILGETYPDLYAGVGAHSGLPYAAAHDMPSAFGAMKAQGARTPRQRPDARRNPVPTIVFHGDRDTTVDASNGEAIVADAVAAWSTASRPRAVAAGRSRAGNRDCSRVDYLDARGRTVVAHCIVHGAGHAWSGGDTGGSFADANGPNASLEMLRFFRIAPEGAGV